MILRWAIYCCAGWLLFCWLRRWWCKRRDKPRLPALARFRIPFLETNYVRLRYLIAGFYVIAARKREGKSYFAVLAGAIELAKPNGRPVIWYMPRMEKHRIFLADLVDALGGQRYAVFERCHWLNREQAEHFWRHRGTWQAEWVEVRTGKGTVEFGPIDYKAHQDRGVVYVLDEFGKLFPKGSVSEDWAELTSYLDMASKIPDTVIGTSVTWGDLVKDMRNKVDVLIRVRNLGRFARFGVRFFSGFWCVWKEDPEHYREGKAPTICWTFTPTDKLVYDAYETEAGDTMVGNQADKGERARGVHVGWLGAAFIALCVAVAGAVIGSGHGVKWLLGLTGSASPFSSAAGSLGTPGAAAVSNFVPKISGPVSVARDLSPRLPSRSVVGRILSFAEQGGQRVFRVTGREEPLVNPRGWWDGRCLLLITGERYYLGDAP